MLSRTTGLVLYGYSSRDFYDYDGAADEVTLLPPPNERYSDSWSSIFDKAGSSSVRLTLLSY